MYKFLHSQHHQMGVPSLRLVKSPNQKRSCKQCANEAAPFCPFWDASFLRTFLSVQFINVINQPCPDPAIGYVRMNPDISLISRNPTPYNACMPKSIAHVEVVGYASCGVMDPMDPLESSDPRRPDRFKTRYNKLFLLPSARLY